jgi:penicillin-binding protein 1C
VRFIVTALLAMFFAASVYALRPYTAEQLPRDARALTFLDRNGLALGTILGRDDRHTVAVPLTRVAPAFLQAMLATEDRRFTAHGALDPMTAARAALVALRNRRLPAGASTISMQLARQLVPVAPGIVGKLTEFAVAQRLENGLSKAQILEAYVNRAPMGSNLYGVEAAARTYFGVDAARLDLAQAALLAGLPNDPVGLDPYAHPAAARARQRLVLARMRHAGFISTEDERRAATEHLAFAAPQSGIVAAAHFLFFLAPRVAPEREIVRTTLDRSLQRFVEAQLRDVVAALAARDVHHAAAIVIDNRTDEVLAYAGSPDYFADANAGRNDGVQALRQPGSTLKPFLYELALERRAIRPTTILADVPVAYAIPGARLYRPSDYAERFAGPVRPRIALADSLNVPAVRVLERIGVPAFLERLHDLGFAHLRRTADYYGLGLTLGGGEVSLYELARAYACAARGGAPVALVTTLDQSVAADAAGGARPGNPAWSWVTDVLADPAARAAAFGTNSILGLPFPAAVKTGTSSDFRDTWTAGFSRDYTVAVWAGNFDGRPMRGISGVTGAAPLWSRIMLHLAAVREPGAFDPPAGYRKAAICAVTGTRPVSGCPIALEWLDAGDRAALAATPPRLPAPGPAFDDWLISQPLRERLPTRILFPHEGDRFVAGSGTLAVELAGPQSARVTLDGNPLRRSGHNYLVPLRIGKFELSARSTRGESTVGFSVGPPLAHGRPGFTAVGPATSREMR